MFMSSVVIFSFCRYPGYWGVGEVFAKYYAGLGSVEIPLSERNFARFGVSTTPTMVLVDGQGIVRLYNPGAASYQLLAGKIEPLLSGVHISSTSKH